MDVLPTELRQLAMQTAGETELNETETALFEKHWCCDLCDGEFHSAEPPKLCPFCGAKVVKVHGLAS